jgi:hypothetical protein
MLDYPIDTLERLVLESAIFNDFPSDISASIKTLPILEKWRESTANTRPVYVRVKSYSLFITALKKVLAISR